MPTANWLAKAAEDQQVPVFFIRIEGLSTDFSTHPVKNAAVTKSVVMEIPKGGGVSIDLLRGTRTVREYQIELLDVDGAITSMVCTEAPGAVVSTLINRRVTMYGGYIDLDEADYQELPGGRITAVRMNDSMTSYVFTIADTLAMLLSKAIMTNAREDPDPADPNATIAKPTRIKGNPVNVLFAILTGNFAHVDFPLTLVSTESANTSAPTGLGIPESEIATASLIAERDLWHSEDVVSLVFTEPEEDAKRYLEEEFFRVFQAYAPQSGSGLLGLKFVVPALSTLDLQSVTHLDHIVEVRDWHRAYEDHLNDFSFFADYDGEPGGSRQFETEFDVTAPEDAADQAATKETAEYRVESKWVRSEIGGEELAVEMIGRLRALYTPGPVRCSLAVTFKRRNLQEGEIVLVTDPGLPDVLTGARGVTGKAMLVLSITPEFEKGLLVLEVMDSSYRRFGAIADDSAPNYDVATPTERATNFYISNDSGVMADGSAGYGFI